MLSIRVITEDGEFVSTQEFGDDMSYIDLLNNHFDETVKATPEGHVVQVIQDDCVMAEANL